MHILILLVALCAFSNGFQEANRDESRPVVKVKHGRLRGFKEESLNGKEFFSFLGIPFAKPPIGDLRFKEPVEAEKWKDILETNKMPMLCLQQEMGHSIADMKSVVHQEDCLYLNVFTPQPNKPRMNLPVMVYIHGGAFIAGGSDLFYPYVLLNEDIVLVVIQYRLGIFGFLSTEDGTLPGNMGIKDQIMALKWVQENIRNFGGDPDKVTIFGESAGGASVHIHMISPASKGLFGGVIAQSGTALCPWAVMKNHKRFSVAVGNEFDCSLDSGTDNYMKCMQEVDAISLLEYATKTVKYGFSPLYTAPRVDGEVIPDEPEILLKEGKYNKVNLMSGITKDEGAIMYLFLNSEIKKKLKEETNSVTPIMLFLEEEEKSKEINEKIIDHYFQGKEIDSTKTATEITKMFGDRYFSICHDLASALHAQDEDISVYRYELIHRGQRSFLNFVNVDQARNWVSHGDDVFYLFSGGSFLGQPLEREEDQKLRTIFTKLWTNFARTWNPTPDESLNFTWHRATARNFEHLSISATPKMAKDNRRQIREFYNSLPTRQNRNLFADGNTNIFSIRKTTGKEKIEL